VDHQPASNYESVILSRDNEHIERVLAHVTQMLIPENNLLMLTGKHYKQGTSRCIKDNE